MENQYKMIILDLDGTLTNKDKEITPKTKEALLKTAENGTKIVLASGRPTAGIVRLANELELKKNGGYILAYNGGNIIDCKSDEVIFKKEIDKELYKDIFDLTEKYDVDILSYEDSYIITNNADNVYAKQDSVINRMPLKQIDDIRNYITWNTPKFIMLEDGDYLASIEGYVKAKLGGKLEVYRSEAFFLEIMPKNIDKANSINKLIEIIGMDKSEIIACGDGYNDLSMVKYAGLGVAMENAVLPVKNVADYITADNNNDGIAKVVYKFLPY